LTNTTEEPFVETEDEPSPHKDWNKVWSSPAAKKNIKKRSSPHPAWTLNWRRSPQNGDGDNKENNAELNADAD
jgi:hypothetical protein